MKREDRWKWNGHLRAVWMAPASMPGSILWTFSFSPHQSVCEHSVVFLGGSAESNQPFLQVTLLHDRALQKNMKVELKLIFAVLGCLADSSPVTCLWRFKAHADAMPGSATLRKFSLLGSPLRWGVMERPRTMLGGLRVQWQRVWHHPGWSNFDVQFEKTFQKTAPYLLLSPLCVTLVPIATLFMLRTLLHNILILIVSFMWPCWFRI